MFISHYEPVELNLEEITHDVDKIIMMRGQTFNVVTYNWRVNVLTDVTMDKRKAKSTIREQGKLLESSKSKFVWSDL